MSHLKKYAARYETDPETLMRWIVEAMVLGALSDGDLDRREQDEIVHYVAKHVEFAGISPSDLDGYVTLAFQGLDADGYRPRIWALRGALPHLEHRILAFRAAVAIAFADGRFADEELGMLREMQAVLEISEDEVSRAFDIAQAEHTMWYVLEADPVQAYLDVLLMGAAADRELHDEQLATVIAFVIDRPEFDDVAEDDINAYIQVSLRAYMHGGTEARLVTLLDDLPSAAHRETAYGLAVAMVSADGKITDTEHLFLQRLRSALELDDARVELTLRTQDS